MGAEVSQQMPVGAKQDLSGNYIRDERKSSTSGSEDENLAHHHLFKLADLERAGIKLNNDLIPPTRNQVHSTFVIINWFAPNAQLLRSFFVA